MKVRKMLSCMERAGTSLPGLADTGSAGRGLTDGAHALAGRPGVGVSALQPASVGPGGDQSAGTAAGAGQHGGLAGKLAGAVATRAPTSITLTLAISIFTIAGAIAFFITTILPRRQTPTAQPAGQEA